MKKLLLLFIPLMFFFGCEEGDEENMGLQLNGVWLHSELMVNGAQENFDWCSEQSHLEFFNNWSANYNEYYTDFPENPAIEPCEPYLAFNITYEATSESNYLMTWTNDYEPGLSGNALVNGNTLIFSAITIEGLSLQWTFIKDE